MALIEREAAESAIAKLMPSLITPDGSDHMDEIIFYAQQMCADAIKAIRDAPTIDAAPVVHGRWVNPHWHNSTSCADCSACGAEACHIKYQGVQQYYKICPSCGALMGGEGNG